MPSTQNLKNFFEPRQLKEILISLAALSIIQKANPDYRYHRFTREYGPGIDLAQIDNGAGDNLFVFFTERGVVLKGFDHNSNISPHALEEYGVFEGIYDGLPLHFENLLENDLSEKEDVTFCIWRETKDAEWKIGPVNFEEVEDDGSGFLLGAIFETPKEFKEWADDYYGKNLSLKIIESVYNRSSLTEQMILELNPECKIDKVKEELGKLGFVFS